MSSAHKQQGRAIGSPCALLKNLRYTLKLDPQPQVDFT